MDNHTAGLFRNLQHSFVIDIGNGNCGATGGKISYTHRSNSTGTAGDKDYLSDEQQLPSRLRFHVLILRLEIPVIWILDMST